MKPTRRDFLKLAGATAITIASGGCPQNNLVYDSADVISRHVYSIGLTPTDIQIDETNLSTLRVDTKEEEISNGYNQDKTFVGISIQMPNSEHPLNFDAELWQRGNSSRIFTKKSYSFEAKESGNPEEDMNVRLFGWDREEDYTLIGCAGDVTMMRNVIPYKIFRQMNPEKNWAPKIQFVEMIFDNVINDNPGNPDRGRPNRKTKKR